MTRTTSDTHRRRRLADTASGISRTNVALWAPPTPGDDASLILDRLRRYAEARDWACVAETTSDDWTLVEQILAAEQIDGIIVPTRALCESGGLQAWLDRGPGFVCEATPGPTQ